MPATIPASTSTSSVLTAQQFEAVWLYAPAGGLTDSRGGPSIGTPPASPGVPAARFTRVARVLISVPSPAVVTYGGNYYAWSRHDFCWLQCTPYPAVLAAASVPAASPLSEPQSF